MEDHEIDRSLEGVVSREIGYLFYYFHHRQALSYELHYFQNTFYIEFFALKKLKILNKFIIMFDQY